MKSLIILPFCLALSATVLSQTLQQVTDNGNYTTRSVWIGSAPISGVTEQALNVFGKIKLLGTADSYTTSFDSNQPTIYRSIPATTPVYPFNVYDNLIFQSGYQNRDIVFVTGTTPTPKMTVTGAGNVGIGTSVTSGYKLAVNGTIAARKVKVTTAAWADFVFEPNYPLRPLSEVESFIRIHRHLPEIPAEKEVIAEGVDLGEMNKKLLQKVEELTLYLIELRKENAGMRKTQEEQVASLVKRIEALEKK